MAAALEHCSGVTKCRAAKDVQVLWSSLRIRLRDEERESGNARLCAVSLFCESAGLAPGTGTRMCVTVAG